MDEQRKIPWSISMLHTYETCPLFFKNKYILKIPEPERELPKGKLEHANDRGSRIHTGCEDFVRGDIAEMPTEAAKHFEEDIEDLKHLYGEGSVMLEHDWCFTEGWDICKRSERDSIFIVDVATWVVKDEWLLIIDYKTGKPYPVKHMDQMQGYALAAYKRMPWLKNVSTELWYLDGDDVSSASFTPNAAKAIENTFKRRVDRMRSDTTFEPASHQFACRFCPYKADCEYFESGVKKKFNPPSGGGGGKSWNSEWKI